MQKKMKFQMPEAPLRKKRHVVPKASDAVTAFSKQGDIPPMASVLMRIGNPDLAFGFDISGEGVRCRLPLTAGMR